MIISSFVLDQTIVALPGWHAWCRVNCNYSRDEDVVDHFTDALVDFSDDMVRGRGYIRVARRSKLMLLADLGDVLSQ